MPSPALQGKLAIMLIASQTFHPCNGQPLFHILMHLSEALQSSFLKSSLVLSSCVQMTTVLCDFFRGDINKWQTYPEQTISSSLAYWDREIFLGLLLGTWMTGRQLHHRQMHLSMGNSSWSCVTGALCITHRQFGGLECLLCQTRLLHISSGTGEWVLLVSGASWD